MKKKKKVKLKKKKVCRPVKKAPSKKALDGPGTPPPDPKGGGTR